MPRQMSLHGFGSKTLGRLFSGGNLSAFFPRLGEADGDRLLAIFDFSALPPFSGTECTVLSPAHRTFHGFAGTLSILAAAVFSSSTGFLGSRHQLSPSAI